MGNKIGSAARFAHIRTRVIDEILPDTMRVYPPARTITGSGSYTETLGDPLLYRGLPDIPCRLDVDKHFHYEAIYGQEATVNQFELHMPYDAPVLSDHKIVMNGATYEVLRLMDTNSFAITKVALVSRTDIGKQS